MGAIAQDVSNNQRQKEKNFRVSFVPNWNELMFVGSQRVVRLTMSSAICQTGGLGMGTACCVLAAIRSIDCSAGSHNSEAV